MSLLHLAYIIAVRRTISNWRMEMVLFVGILLAVAVMSSGVVFSDLLAEAALRREMNQAAPDEANFSIRTHNDFDFATTVADYQRNMDFVESRAGEPFKPFLRDQSYLLETETFFFRGRPQLELDIETRPRGKFMYMTGLISDRPDRPDRVELVKGSWPGTSTSTSPPTQEPLEVAVDTLGAELLGLRLDDTMTVFPAAVLLDRAAMEVKIVGLFRRTDLDPADEFWYGTRDALRSRIDDWNTIHLFTTEDTILKGLSPNYPRMFAEITWFFYLDREKVRAGHVNGIQRTIRQMKRDMGSDLDNSTTSIELDKLLEDYEEQLLLSRVPMFLMLFLVTGILIYYLFLVGSLVVRFRASEISVLKSRGSTTFQIGLLALGEGLLLAVPAVFLGPILALGVSRALERVFFDVGVADVPVFLSFGAVLLGFVGALIAVTVLTTATMLAARQGVVESRQSGARPPQAPLMHRYYLDILLLALIGLVWWQIQSHRSFLVRPLGTGELEIDWSLLIGPALGLLAAGLLVLRLFPIGAALLFKVSEPVGPVWLVQGLRRISRDPIIPGTLVVLLMLATALGLIGSAFSSTLERSQRDRALYSAGADLRIHHRSTETEQTSARIERLPGVRALGIVERGRGPSPPGLL